MEGTKRRLYAEPSGFWTEAAILFTALAIVFRLIGSIGRWNDMHYLITMVALPIFSGLLFMLCLLMFSKKAFWTTVIPVVLGVAFFIFVAMTEENELLKVGYIVLYVVIVVFYTMTFSHPKLKWVLALILLLVFAYHVVLKDLPVLMDLEHPVSFVDGVQEMSVLGIILAMLSVSLAMKMPKKPAEEPTAVPVEPAAPVAPAAPVEPAPTFVEEKPAEAAAPYVLEKPAAAPYVPEKPAAAETPETKRRGIFGRREKPGKPAAAEKPAEAAAPVEFQSAPAPVPEAPAVFTAPEEPEPANWVEPEEPEPEPMIVEELPPVAAPVEVYPLEEQEEEPWNSSPAEENRREET